MPLPALMDVLEEYQLLEAEDRYRLLIDLGRQLEPMPEALKTDATKVRGCSASVWVYPTASEGRLHFLADSNAAITKGIVALILSGVQDKPAAEVARMDVAEMLAVRAQEASQCQPDSRRSEYDCSRETDRRALRCCSVSEGAPWKMIRYGRSAPTRWSTSGSMAKCVRF